MKFILLLISLVVLTNCSSSVKKNKFIINLTADKKRVTPTLTSEDFKIHSIDNIIPQGKGGNKRIFIIKEGFHRVDASLNRIRCISYGGGLATIPGIYCNKTVGDLISVKFTARKGMEYKLVPKPGKKSNTTIGLVINKQTGKIVSN